MNGAVKPAALPRAPQALFSTQLLGVAVAPDATLYIADAGNARLRMVTPGGVVSVRSSLDDISYSSI